MPGSDVQMPQEQDQPTRLIKLERKPNGELVAYLSDRDEPVEQVRVARCFPWSCRDGYVSISDSQGRELVLLVDLEGLEPATRELIEQELREKFFVPKILRILDYKAEFDVVSISAETDRGQVTFQIRDRDDVRLLSPTRALFRDVDGNIYEIEDFTALDRASQRRLEQFF